jgi:transposase-like protein
VASTGVGEDSRREILGIAIGEPEDVTPWTEFLRSLRCRGLCGVQLVISDSHLGLKAAIAKVDPGAGWQCFQVHFMRNVLVRVPRSHLSMAAVINRTILAQLDSDHLERRAREVAAMMKRHSSLVTEMPMAAGEDVTAFRYTPANHWQKIWSTSSLERPDAEIKRRNNMVGIFSNHAGVTHHGSVLGDPRRMERPETALSPKSPSNN